MSSRFGWLVGEMRHSTDGALDSVVAGRGTAWRTSSSGSSVRLKLEDSASSKRQPTTWILEPIVNQNSLRGSRLGGRVRRRCCRPRFWVFRALNLRVRVSWLNSTNPFISRVVARASEVAGSPCCRRLPTSFFSRERHKPGRSIKEHQVQMAGVARPCPRHLQGSREVTYRTVPEKS